MRRVVVASLVAGGWLAAASGGPFAASRQSAGATPPRLLVVVVADQMRADHLVTFQQRWKKGFRVLLNEGAYFPRAEFPYLNNVTCAGHTTIGTGAYPRSHGIILNGWWRRDLKLYRNCMDDSTAPHISYGRPAAGGSSAANIVVPTLADELHALQPLARI